MTLEEKILLTAALNAGLILLGLKVDLISGQALVAKPEEWLTTKQAARLLGISPRTMEDWRRRKIGPKWQRISFRGPAKIYYARSEIEKFRPRY